MSAQAVLLTVRNQTRQTLLGSAVEIADTFSTRLVGLLGRRSLGAGKGLLIHPSCSVHTIGMAFAIDVLFLGRDHRVVGLSENLSPFRISPIHLRAECVLELPASTIRQSCTQLGDLLDFHFATPQS